MRGTLVGYWNSFSCFICLAVIIAVTVGILVQKDQLFSLGICCVETKLARTKASDCEVSYIPA